MICGYTHKSHLVKLLLFFNKKVAAILIGLVLGTGVYAQLYFEKRGADIGINHFFISNDRLMGGGVAFFDYNNDGYEDIYITAGIDRDKLYHNNGDGTFREIGILAGLALTADVMTLAVATGDIDNDGDRDIFVGTSSIFSSLLFLNHGDGTFTDISASAGISSDKVWNMSVSFGDINLDGFLDIYVGNYVEIDRILTDQEGNVSGFAHECYSNYLYLNNGDRSFTEVGAAYFVDDLGCALATTFTDYDQDGDVDILTANDFGEWVVPNKLFRNEYPEPFFSDVSESSRMDAPMYGMGIATGDYDQDWDLDYYITNLGRNALFMNLNNGKFEDVTALGGVEDVFSTNNSLAVGWGTVFVDVDNDTDLDLVVVNGHIPAASFIFNLESNPDRLFLNNGDFSFTDYAPQAGTDDDSKGRGLAYADYDNDGDIDYLIVPVNSINSPDSIESVVLFQNQLQTNFNWLKIKLRGTVSNRDAYGAQLKLKVGGRKLMAEIQGGNSHVSQSSSIAHFGLGEAEQVDSLWVIWPGGNQQLFTDLAANQTINITEDPERFITNNRNDLEDPIKFFVFPNPLIEQLHIEYHLASSSKLSINVYNSFGQHIQLLSQGIKPAGPHQLYWETSALATGIYLIHFETDKHFQTTKILKIP